MLKKRLLTSMILIPLMVVFVLFADRMLFLAITALILLLAASEWATLMNTSRKLYKWLFILGVLVGFFALLFVPITIKIYIAAFWWLFAAILVSRYKNDGAQHPLLFKVFSGLMVFWSCWVGLITLRALPDGNHWVLLLLIIVWGADSGAYFAGKYWGKQKILPSVSPGKTFEGLYGAFFTTLLLAPIFGYFLTKNHMSWIMICIVSLITVMFSVVGDLFESMFKRMLGVKDSSSLLPGHGGLLDRIDSLTAAAPIFAIGVLFSGV